MSHSLDLPYTLNPQQEYTLYEAYPQLFTDFDLPTSLPSLTLPQGSFLR